MSVIQQILETFLKIFLFSMTAILGIFNNINILQEIVNSFYQLLAFGCPAMGSIPTHLGLVYLG